MMSIAREYFDTNLVLRYYFQKFQSGILLIE